MHFLVALSLLAWVPGQEGHERDPSESIPRASNELGFDLYRKLREEPGNLVFSPVSIFLALGAASHGARGETAEQMLGVLHLEESPTAWLEPLENEDYVFRIANQMFGEKTYPFERAFLERAELMLGSSLEQCDFRNDPEASRLRVNEWVEGKTEDRIQDLLPPESITRDTRLVLVNAIYFLGDWAEPFEVSSTRLAPFFLSKTDKKEVELMERTGAFRFARAEEFSALEIPYKGVGMSMLFVLPDAVDGLEALEQAFGPSELEATAAALTSMHVRAMVPRFTMKPAQSLPLKKMLAELGMPLAFDRKQADFTGIANPPDPEDRLYIEEVFHKAFIRVDEEGTEAAAATGVLMPRVASAAADPIEFKADHPFLFFLRYDDAVLFMGRVANPGAGGS